MDTGLFLIRIVVGLLLVGQEALRHRHRQKRDAGGFQEGADFVLGPRISRALADDRERTLRRRQQAVAGRFGVAGLHAVAERVSAHDAVGVLQADDPAVVGAVAETDAAAAVGWPALTGRAVATSVGVGCGGMVLPGGCVFPSPCCPGEGDGESLGFGAKPQIRQLKRP